MAYAVTLRVNNIPAFPSYPHQGNLTALMWLFYPSNVRLLFTGTVLCVCDESLWYARCIHTEQPVAEVFGDSSHVTKERQR